MAQALYVGKRQFLQASSRYLKEAEEKGRELIITYHDEPRLRVISIPKKTIRDLKGSLKKCSVNEEDVNTPILPGFDTW